MSIDQAEQLPLRAGSSLGAPAPGASTGDDRWRSRVCALFFVTAMVTGLLVAMILPLGQAADEEAHLLRIEAISHGTLLGHREGLEGGVRASSTFFSLGFGTLPGQRQTKEQHDAMEAAPWRNDRPMFHLGTIATYFPVVYLPGAIVMAAGRHLDATPAETWRACRALNVVIFSVIGAAALRLTRRGAALIACTLLMPMTLALAASPSGEGTLIACAATAVACLTRGTVRGWHAAAVLILGLALTKLPYAPLLLALVPSAPARLAPRARVGAVTAAVAMCVAWAACNQAWVQGTEVRPPYEAGPLWPGPPRTFEAIAPGSQLEVLEADPTLAVTLVVRMLVNGGWLFSTMIGVLGWLNIYMPDALYVLWKMALAVSVAALLLEPGPRPGPALVGLVAISASVWAIALAQYLGWTPVGAAEISGVQGRYFLPVLPFACLAVPHLRTWPVGAASLPAVALGLAGTVVIPVTIGLACYLT